MNKEGIFAIIFFLFGLQLSIASGQNQFPRGFVPQAILDGLNPVTLTIDHHGRIWLVEKHGEIKIVGEDGHLLEDPLLSLPVDDYNERGLLGVALHPDMDNHPFVYVYYTVPEANHNRVSRFTVNGDLVVPGSEQILIDLDTLSGFIHNGGALAFGEDGKLYIATGDGGAPPQSQNLKSTLGKILRINPDGSIPEDNPFYSDQKGKEKSIWAYGLRNPFSMAIQHGTGRIFVCDVGLGDFEEVNEISKGKNYGWPLVEGPWIGGDPPPDYEDPFYSYSHDEGCAIVGAVFYNAEVNHFPELYQNKFFFADFCEGFIHFINPETGRFEGVFAEGLERPLAFCVNEATGEMYYLSRAGLGGGSPEDNTSTQIGSLWKISYRGDGKPIIALNPSSQLRSVGEEAVFSVQAFGSPPLVYTWQKNGVDFSVSDSTVLSYPNTQLTDDGAVFRVIVSNSEGADTSEVAVLSVTSNQRPNPFIQLPLANSLFQAGDTLFFTGMATDKEDGDLSDQQLCWSIDLHHDNHTHPALEKICGMNEGIFVIPLVNETDTNIWYRIYLSAEDSHGLKKTVYREVFPELTKINLNGPKGLEVNIDGKIIILPYTFYSQKNLKRTIEVPLTQIIGDTLFLFHSWENGSSALLRTFNADSSHQELTLDYEALALGSGQGLKGEYYSGLGFPPDKEPVFERIDSSIQFIWGGDNPFRDTLMNDYFTIRWTGEIQSVFTDEYTFYVRADDGVRLWIGDSLIIDKWIAQPATEHTGKFFMESGKLYPIRIEYFELTGLAEISLWWRSTLTTKEIIPFSQLYPPPVFEPIIISGQIFLDQNGDYEIDPFDTPLRNMSVLLLDSINQEILSATQSNLQGEYIFKNLSPGTYYLQFSAGSHQRNLFPVTSLNSWGETKFFTLSPGQNFIFDALFFDFSKKNGTGLLNTMVFPNPGREVVNIEIIGLEEKNVRIRLMDPSGKVFMEKNLLVTKGRNLFNVEIQDLLPGPYILSMEDDRGVVSRKWFKAAY